MRAAKTVQAQPLTNCCQSDLSWIRQFATGIALTGLFLSLLARGKAEAVSFTFEKIADTNTPIPGGTGTFGGFSNLSLDDGDVAFGNTVSEQRQVGIYTNIGGKLNVIADTNTPIPGGTGTFEGFGFYGASIDNGHVAFIGSDTYSAAGLGKGIYMSVGGELNIIADTNTPIPNGTGNFEGFSDPLVNNGDVAFIGNDQFNDEFGLRTQVGIYTNIDGKLNVISDLNTPIPGGTGNFVELYSPSLDDGDVAFFGRGPSLGLEDFRQEGIYTNIGGTLDIVADENTSVPSGTGNFEEFRITSIANGNVAFSGNSETFEQGVYTNVDGTLDVVANETTPILQSTNNFFYGLSLDNENVAFLDDKGIYISIGGTLAKVIAEGDSLDGKRLSAVSLGTESLSGNQIAFNAYFDDDSEGIYIVTVPEPTSVLGTLAFGAFGTSWMLMRKLKKQKSVTHTQGVE